MTQTDPKIQLEHPQGKQAVRMDPAKYQVLRKAILEILQTGAMTHTEMYQAINLKFANEQYHFPGSIQWHLQSVKMDMEAKKLIIKEGANPQSYRLP